MNRKYAPDADVENIELLPHYPPRFWGFPPAPAKPAVPTLTNEYLRTPRHWVADRPQAPARPAGSGVWPSQWIRLDRWTGEANYIGWWLRQHFQKLARESGTYAIAKRLRKQGLPVHVAVMVLTGRRPPVEE